MVESLDLVTFGGVLIVSGVGALLLPPESLRVTHGVESRWLQRSLGWLAGVVGIALGTALVYLGL